MWGFVVVAAIVLAIVLLVLLVRSRRVVREYQWGLRYRAGRLIGQLEAGAYWLIPFREELVLVDRRRVTFVVGGQEMASQDNIGVKVSAVVLFEIADAALATQTVQDYRAELYARVQLALRDEISSRDIDDLLAVRGELNEALTARLTAAAEGLGLELKEVAVRDFMLANDLKRAFHEVLKARKEGEAALERSRAETAALRNLANATRLLRDNPELLTLRVVAAIERSQGNTFQLPELRPERESEA